MAKTGTINMRIDQTAKEKAADVCDRYGLSLSKVLELCVYQIGNTGDLPLRFSREKVKPDSEQRTVRLGIAKGLYRLPTEEEEAEMDAEIAKQFEESVNE